MAKNSITDYSKTASLNTDIQSVDIDEGCLPSGINNAIRELMADLAAVNDGTVSLTSPSFAAASLTGNLSLGDNNKAIFGAGSDLEIYHDGSNSWIHDRGTGNLNIEGRNVFIVGANNDTILAGFIDGAEARLYYNGSQKLATTSTGIDVTGTVTADGLTVEGTGDLGTIGNGSFNQSAALGFQNDRAFFGYSSSQNALIQSGASKGVAIEVNNDTLDSGTRAALFASNGDISFYEDTGTTPKLTWDASAESLGLSKEISFTNTANTSGFDVGLVGGDSDATAFIYQRANDSLNFGTNNLERLRITSAGLVGIGVTDPSEKLEVAGSVKLDADNAGIQLKSGITGTEGLIKWTFNTDNTVYAQAGITFDTRATDGFLLDVGYPITIDATTNIKFKIAGSEEMRLEADGDLHVDGNVIAYSTTISDKRLKKDIAPIDNALWKVSQLNGCTFTYLKDDRKSAGLIAQDLEKVLPSAVIEDEAVFHGEEGETYKTVQYDQVIGLLVEAVKELKAEIEELKDASNK